MNNNKFKRYDRITLKKSDLIDPAWNGLKIA